MKTHTDITPEQALAEAADLEQQAQERRSFARNIFGRRDEERRQREAAYDQALLGAYDRGDWERRQAAARDAFFAAVAESPIAQAWVDWHITSEMFEHAAALSGDRVSTGRLRSDILDDLIAAFQTLELQARADEQERQAAERQAAIDGTA